MKFERNKKSKKWFLCGLICVVVLTIIISLKGSKAGYRSTASIELTSGTVTASPYDFKLISMYLNDGDGNYVEDKTNTIPKGDYTINESKSYCYKTDKTKKDGGNVYTDELGNHVITGTSKGSKCIIYFDKNNDTAKTMTELLENHYKARSVRKDGTFNQIVGNTTMGVIYEAEDDDGTTYYFVGNPLDNWIEFGGYYWRIIRINGNGSIRMIYQGRVEDENGNKLDPQATGEETQIGTSSFNSSDSSIKIGYFYEEDGIVKPSIIYTYLNDWFNNSNIRQGTIYFNKIDKNSGFFGDRTIYSDNEGTKLSSTGKGYTGAFIRLFIGTTGPACNYSERSKPSFKTINNEDLYTYNYEEQTKGNKLLDNPVGLITADEAFASGMYFAWNENCFLYTNQTYWTISPYTNSDYRSYVIPVVAVGYTGNYGVNNALGVRPVINLRSDTQFTGDGTESNSLKVIV